MTSPPAPGAVDGSARRAGVAGPVVTFFLRDASPELAALDRDAGWRELETGERCWILQTYLLLRSAGLPVALSSQLRDGWIVYHAKDWRLVESLGAARRRHAVLVATRGDVRPVPNADFEIVQNPATADGRRRFFLPLWTQPGLVPRDPARGEAVRRAAFKGFRANLHPALRDPEWIRELAARGVEWVADAVDFSSVGADEHLLAWPDFRDVDAVVALRPPQRDGYLRKPATKLFNAWLAGVPAILGREEAYRRERRSELDFLEIADPRDALAAIERLQREPGLYRAMVENGRARAHEIEPAALVERWRTLLWETLPDTLMTRPLATWRALPRPLRLWVGRAYRALH